MAKLNYYQDKDNENEEYVVIITSPDYERECEEELNLKLIDTVELYGGDLSSWPTDRLLIQE